MSDVLEKPSAQSDAEIIAEIDRMFDEMQLMNEQKRRDQADIDRLTVESEILKAEGRRLNVEAHERMRAATDALDRLQGVH